MSERGRRGWVRGCASRKSLRESKSMIYEAQRVGARLVISAPPVTAGTACKGWCLSSVSLSRLCAKLHSPSKATTSRSPPTGGVFARRALL